MARKEKIVIEFGGTPCTFCKRILLKNDKTPKRGKQLSMTVISCIFKSNIKTFYNKGEKTVSRDSQLEPLNIGVCLLYC